MPCTLRLTRRPARRSTPRIVPDSMSAMIFASPVFPEGTDQNVPAARAGNSELCGIFAGNPAIGKFVGEIDRPGDEPVVHLPVFSEDIVGSNRSLVARQPASGTAGR